MARNVFALPLTSATIIVITIIMLACDHLPAVSATRISKPRFRRNVRDLYDMMTNANFKTMKVAEVLGYGRFCGLGNTATQQGMNAEQALAPLDAIDACCKVHDLCYDKLSEIGGKCRPPLAAAQLSSMMHYLTPYYMEKVDVKAQQRAAKKARSAGAAAMADAENGEFVRCKGYDWSFIDSKIPFNWITTCGVALCGCDYTFAKCLKENEAAFNRSNLSTRSLVDQASDQYGPAARHSLELVRTSATIGKVHSNVMEIFDFFSWVAPDVATTGTQTDAESAVAAAHETARTLNLTDEQSASATWWSSWG